MILSCPTVTDAQEQPLTIDEVLHRNVQRRPSQKETAGRLLHIAEILEKQGVPDDEVLHHIVELVPYSLRWIQRLLPDKYKEVERTHLLVPRLYNVWSFAKCDSRFGTLGLRKVLTTSVNLWALITAWPGSSVMQATPPSTAS